MPIWTLSGSVPPVTAPAFCRALAPFQLDPSCITEDGRLPTMTSWESILGLSLDYSFYRHEAGYKTDGFHTVGFKRVTVTENTTFTFSAFSDPVSRPVQLTDDSWYSGVLDFYIGMDLTAPEVHESLVGYGTKEFSVTIPTGTWYMVWLVTRRAFDPETETYGTQPEGDGTGECRIYDLDPVSAPQVVVKTHDNNPVVADIPQAKVKIFSEPLYWPDSDFNGAVQRDFQHYAVQLQIAQVQNRPLVRFLAHAPSLVAVADTPRVLLPIVAKSSFNQWILPPEKQVFLKTIYVLVLTGGADGLADVELPMASFTAKPTEEGQAYTSIIIPNITAYADSINARQNGQLIIYKGVEDQDGNRQLEKLLITNFDYLRQDVGAINQSGSITGYKYTGIGGEAEFYIENVSYRSTDSQGRIRLRGDVDHNAAVGQICYYGSEYFKIREMVLVVYPGRSYMEVAE